MKLRKTILLSAIAVLLCVYIAQLVIAGKSSIKTLTLKDEVATYTISANASGSDSDVVLTKDGDAWIVGSKNYVANQAFSDNIKDAVASLKVLDTVSHSDAETVLERYGLDSAKAFTVTAADKSGKVLRTIIIGKESTTGSQTYAKVDSSKDIYLISGSLKNTFAKSVEDLRSHGVFNFKEQDLTKITVSRPGSSWSIEKTSVQSSDANSPAIESWKYNGNGSVELDEEKVKAWVNTLPVLNVQDWREETAPLPRIAGTTVTLTTAEKEITVTVYEISSSVEGQDNEYIGTSSETPYSFTMSKYVGQKFLKEISELTK